jgi:hypothetical protein
MGRHVGGDDDDIDTTAETFIGARKGSRRPGTSDSVKPRQDDDDGGKTLRVRPGWVEQSGQAVDILPAGWLVVTDGPGLGKVVTIQEDTNLCGHGRKNDIRLNFGDRTISEDDHVRFSYTGDTRRFRISEGKGKRTRVNGEPLEGARTLERGDIVMIGQTTLRFVPFCDEGFDWETDPSKK